MQSSSEARVDHGVFERPTHLLLFVPEESEAAVPFNDPLVRWSMCASSAECLAVLERAAIDAVIVKASDEDEWALPLLAAAQPLARARNIAFFVWAPAGTAARKKFYRAGATDLFTGASFTSEDILRLWARMEPRGLSPDDQMRLLRYGDLVLDPVRFLAWRGERRIRLSALQVELLQPLMLQPHHVFTRDELAETVWAGRPLDQTNVRSCFRRLRQALNGPGERELVRTIRDRGYALDIVERYFSN